MRVVVCSKSPLKRAAVERAVAQLDLEPDGDCVQSNAPSGVSDQPQGLQEIDLGATIRLGAGRRLDPKPDVAIAAENGLIAFGGHAYDVAVVKVELESGAIGTATSVGVQVPDAIVAAAREPGKTVGKAIVARMGGQGDHRDPHSELTGGRRSRVDLLTDAIVAAYGIAERK